MTRAYTVAEIDNLRSVCEDRWLWGSSYWETTDGPNYRMLRTYKEEEKAKCVEELVRTAMLAGHTADDIRASDRERAERHKSHRLSGSEGDSPNRVKDQ